MRIWGLRRSSWNITVRKLFAVCKMTLQGLTSFEEGKREPHELYG